MVCFFFFLLMLALVRDSPWQWELLLPVFCKFREFLSLFERLFLQNICCLFQNAIFFQLLNLLVKYFLLRFGKIVCLVFFVPLVEVVLFLSFLFLPTEVSWLRSIESFEQMRQ